MTHGHPFASGTVAQFSAVAYAGGGNAKGLAYDETFIDELLDRYSATELFTSVISVRQVCALLPEQHVAASPAAVSLSLPVFRFIDGS
jgi:hypothetical protein